MEGLHPLFPQKVLYRSTCEEYVLALICGGLESRYVLALTSGVFLLTILALTPVEDYKAAQLLFSSFFISMISCK